MQRMKRDDKIEPQTLGNGIEIPKDIQGIQHHLREVLEGDAFKGSPRSCQFLSHIVDHAISGNLDSLKERMIGIEVFGRSPSYDTAGDAIVRVTASDVRKRLLQHYGRPGGASGYRISLPPGSYAPQISHVSAPESYPTEVPAQLSSFYSKSIEKSLGLVETPPVQPKERSRATRWILAACIFTAVNLAATLLFSNRSAPMDHRIASLPPWSQLFSSQWVTEFITSDPNIAEIQGFTDGQLSLSDYANHNYIPHPELLTPEQDRFCRVILRGDKASIVDTRIAASVAQLAESVSRQISVTGARMIQLSDLQTNKNLVLVGSPRSNPWTNIFNDHLDFRFEFDPSIRKEIIRNVKPRPNELPSYVATAPGWATGQSFAIVAFVQNPDQAGQVLMLSGENGEGTEAAGKLVSDWTRLSNALNQCGIKGSGSSQHFEMLLRLNTLAGSPSNVDMLACHIL
jgi:hypothetical protein